MTLPKSVPAASLSLATVPRSGLVSYYLGVDLDGVVVDLPREEGVGGGEARVVLPPGQRSQPVGELAPRHVHQRQAVPHQRL